MQKVKISLTKPSIARKTLQSYHIFFVLNTFLLHLHTKRYIHIMKIGDKVRFLNDVGGGTITAFRQGGIVLVEDEDGFDMPVRQDEVVVIEESTPKVEEKRSAPKIEYGTAPVKEQPQKKQGEKAGKPEVQSLNGKEYLQSKTVRPADADEDIDENMEARIVRLELTIQKLEARIARLEAENNLRKNEKLMKRQQKHHEKPLPPTQLEELQIL